MLYGSAQHLVPLCRTEGFDNVVEFGAQGGDASYDFGEAVLELVDVDLLSGVARFHIGADREVVVGSHDVFKGGKVRHVLFLHLIGKESENLVEMSIGEDVVVGRLLVESAEEASMNCTRVSRLCLESTRMLVAMDVP